jgi:hypothetical protein
MLSTGQGDVIGTIELTRPGVNFTRVSRLSNPRGQTKQCFTDTTHSLSLYNGARRVFERC